MFADYDVKRRKAEREAADQIYNEALTALDRSVPGVPDLPHPPVEYDEHRVTPLNEQWQILREEPAPAYTGWRGALARFVWELVRPVFERQQSFNSVLVDHINRNVAVHRANRQAIASTLGAFRAELEKLEGFHTRLILYLQTITLYVDTKDRSEHIATLVNFVRSGLGALSDELTRRLESSAMAISAVAGEFQQRWESMLVRDERQTLALDELRTTAATVQQMGLTLKRELERMLAEPERWSPAASATGAVEAEGPGRPAAGSQAQAFDATVNAYKYVGFENKFRGSEAEIRERQLSYVQLFQGASDVLDVGCGRGEFLALLREHGISGRGLDINHEMVESCRAGGHTVDESDAVTFLNGLPDGSLGGLIALQVVEHFPPAYLMTFLDTAYHKLRPGSTIVLETLNPASWFAFFEAYIRDVTHAWPLHPETLKYLVVASGFQNVDVRYSSPYPADAKLQHCRVAGPTPLGMQNLIHVLNENVDKINTLIFGNMDYAVTARRL